MLSDIHAGSYFSVWPRDDIITGEGNNLTNSINDGQRTLQEYWYDKLIPVAKRFKVDTVMNAADACDGTNRKEGGGRSITPDLDYQKRAAVALLKPVVKGRNYHAVSGSPYHESWDTKIHKQIVEDLRGTAKSSSYHGMLLVGKLMGTNKHINFAHAATSAMIYSATVLDRERIFLKAAEGMGKLDYSTDYFVRGHLHHYFHLDYPDMHIVQLPCWKSHYSFGGKVRLYGKHQPDIGATILLIDKDDRTFMLHFIYPAPKISDFVKDI